MSGRVKTGYFDPYLSVTLECLWVFSPPGIKPGSLRWESVIYQWGVELLSTQSH